MSSDALESAGFAYYVAQLRNAAVDPYIAYRVYERGWRVPPNAAALLRRATIQLIESDPWFLATTTPIFLSPLPTADLEHLTPLVGTGPARAAAPMLRAILWYHGGRSAYRTDRVGRMQLRRALTFLRRVPAKQRDRAWHEMIVGCYRVLDYAQYKRAFPKLQAVTPPSWHAVALHDFLDVVAAKKDWTTYDRYRPHWDRLPANHEACECYLNAMHTNDGLRAAAARAWDAIPDALAKAATVRGCPHLCSAGMRLDLVRLLLAKRKHLPAARAYLAHATSFAHTPELATLRARLAGLE